MRKDHSNNSAHRPGAGNLTGQQVSGKRLLGAALFTISGFGIAILSNWLLPQVAETTNAIYEVGAVTLTRNSFYRLVLLG
ncbi:MAG: hypothetical protein LJU34_03660, partial [Oscillospiraceae bacterium]|nr:hypothetical protein [Oscillospiraceae bacterium]